MIEYPLIISFTAGPTYRKDPAVTLRPVYRITQASAHLGIGWSDPYVPTSLRTLQDWVETGYISTAEDGMDVADGL